MQFTVTPNVPCVPSCPTILWFCRCAPTVSSIRRLRERFCEYGGQNRCQGCLEHVDETAPYRCLRGHPCLHRQLLALQLGWSHQGDAAHAPRICSDRGS